jgi:hypothetical protein
VKKSPAVSPLGVSVLVLCRNLTKRVIPRDRVDRRENHGTTRHYSGSIGQRKRASSRKESLSFTTSFAVTSSEAVIQAPKSPPSAQLHPRMRPVGRSDSSLRVWLRRMIRPNIIALRAHDVEMMADLPSKVLHEQPAGSKHWSARTAAQEAGISKSSVARYFGPCSVCNPVEQKASSCPPIRSSSRRSAPSSVFA